jgi:hypothetical protein
MRINLLVLAAIILSILSPVDIIFTEQPGDFMLMTLDVCHQGTHFLSAASDNPAFCEFAGGVTGHEFSGFHTTVPGVCDGLLLAVRMYPPPRHL